MLVDEIERGTVDARRIYLSYVDEGIAVMNGSTNRTVLISGASIAGPALAYWLHRYGITPTVVERSAAVRGGGYPIDVRGTAVDVVERMGLSEQVRAAHIGSRLITFLDVDGARLASIDPEVMTGSVSGRDVELRRGDLTDALFGAVSEDVEFLFGDSIATLDEHDDGVDVTFVSGAQRTFDLVIGADGLHSTTRGLVFGPEEPFHRYLGQCFAGFTMSDPVGLSHEAVVWNQVGRSAVLYAVGESEQVHAFLNITRADPPLDAFATPQAQCDLVAAAFEGDGWEVGRIVSAMYRADDLFFDVVSQIHMPGWSRGRVVLAGDAAHAPSFLSGQGSSLALVGAYVLAGEIATRADHREAFAAYERRLRGFVTRNQALAGSGGRGLTPHTEEEFAARNRMLLRPEAVEVTGGDARRGVHSSFVLPEYEPASALT